jgi:uncharacterized protein
MQKDQPTTLEERVAALTLSRSTVRVEKDANHSEHRCRLHFACRLGRVEVVRLLIREGAEINLRDASGRTPLHVATSLGHATCLKALLSAHAEVDWLDDHGNTALYTASQLGLEYCVVDLLQAHAAPDAQRADGSVALHVASEEGYTCCVQQLLVAHANPDCMRFTGMTQLALASQHGHAKCVERLLAANATPDLLHPDCPGPLAMACEAGHDGCVQWLLAARASVNAMHRGQPLLAVACKYGNERCVEWLIHAHAAVDLAGTDGVNGLHAACLAGHLGCVSLLLVARSDPNQPTAAGKTPLALANATGHREIGALLQLQGGSDRRRKPTTPVASPYLRKRAQESVRIERALETVRREHVSTSPSTPQWITPGPVQADTDPIDPRTSSSPLSVPYALHTLRTPPGSGGCNSARIVG